MKLIGQKLLIINVLYLSSSYLSVGFEDRKNCVGRVMVFFFVVVVFLNNLIRSKSCSNSKWVKNETLVSFNRFYNTL